MKRLLLILLIVIFIAAGYFVVSLYYPKSTGRFPFLLALVAGDFYLWGQYRKAINKLNRFTANSLKILYWLPLALMMLMTLTSIFSDLPSWNEILRVYVLGFVLIAYVSKLVPITALFLSDILRMFRWVSGKMVGRKPKPKPEAVGPKISRSRFLVYSGTIGGGLLFSGLLAGMVRWAYDFRIRYVPLQLSGLPKEFEGWRIVQISDTHLGSWPSEDKMKEMVSLINEQDPHLFFFTGDLVNYKTDEAFRFEKHLANIRVRKGAFAVLGNHDYGDYAPWPDRQAKAENMNQLNSFYDRLNWKLLRNENVVFGQGKEGLAIAGVENWGALSRFPRYGDLDKALTGAENVPVKLLLSHDPSHWNQVIRNYSVPVDATFSGHTHGAQFGVEIPGFRWSPSQYVYKQWAGLYQDMNLERTINLYVNRGAGTIGYPGRVGIWPEITVFELKG